VGIPRKVEKFLGDWVFYPLNSGNMRATHELLPGTNERIADKVENVLGRLKNANAGLLNPQGETPFDYRVKTVFSSQINAFAVPAGGMVVFTQLVKEIDGAIKSGAIRESTVTFADGSTATLDLRQVTMEDALAALMGHEMTHVASRHSIVAIFGSLIRTVLLHVGRFCFLGYLKTQDREYQDLTAKPEAQLSAAERAALAHKEQFYSRVNDLFAWIGEKCNDFAGLFHSRKNEYEADVTGTCFAKAAQFNPLGAIYLQEILNQNRGGIGDMLHKHLEFLFTHPYGENRKRAILAAIQEIDPQGLQGRIRWAMSSEGTCAYDLGRSSPALRFARAWGSA
jgi:Zn-dependent protease with chaperone function